MEKCLEHVLIQQTNAFYRKYYPYVFVLLEKGDNNAGYARNALNI